MGDLMKMGHLQNIQSFETSKESGNLQKLLNRVYKGSTSSSQHKWAQGLSFVVQQHL